MQYSSGRIDYLIIHIIRSIPTIPCIDIKLPFRYHHSLVLILVPPLHSPPPPPPSPQTPALAHLNLQKTASFQSTSKPPNIAIKSPFEIHLEPIHSFIVLFPSSFSPSRQRARCQISSSGRTRKYREESPDYPRNKRHEHTTFYCSTPPRWRKLRSVWIPQSDCEEMYLPAARKGIQPEGCRGRGEQRGEARWSVCDSTEGRSER